MYDTRLIEEDLSLESLLEYTTEYDIYSHYIGDNFDIGKIMPSPLRQDKHPSFGIFKSDKYGNLMFKDQATGVVGDCITFVSKLFDISRRRALAKISSDIQNKRLSYSVEGVDIQKEYKTISTIISVKKKPFCKTDDEYWGQFSLERDDLRHFNVFPITEYWLNGIVQPWGYKQANPGYAYEIYNKYKLYFPLSDKRNKWISNCSNFDIQGYEQLDGFGDLLIITKALKDVMVLHKLEYQAIAPQGENHSIPEKIMKDLKSRFTNIIVFYDNDKAGVAGAQKIANKFELKTISIPQEYPKDISDYTKEYGLDNSKELLNNLLNGKI
jgi:5S rRNA maturation endonuclease (ribonuclease M5)